MNRLNIFKTHPDIVLPKFATKQAACFDLSYQFVGKTEYSGYNMYNAPFTRPISNGGIRIMQGDRVLVPTGLIFDILEGYSVRIHPRSGLSYKQGLILANLEAVIDSDYIQETFVLLTNRSEVDITINNGDRIAQAEMVKKEEYVLWEIFEAPTQKTDRVGGLGSTGVATVVINSSDITLTEEEMKKYAVQEVVQEEPPVKRGRGRPRKVA
jgi:dUTP pyrophosphatase